LKGGLTYRYGPAVAGETLKTTPLFDQHRALGGRMVPFAGYHMPVQYSGVVKEHHAVRSAAGLFDVSHMGRLVLNGEYALAVTNHLVTNDVAQAADGQAVYTACCNERGGILDDLIVYRRRAEEIWIVCNASNRDKIVRHFSKAAENHCGFEDRSDATALIALQGPLSFKVLENARASASILGLSRFRVGDGTVGSISATAARTGYTGEDGVELFCREADAVALWRTLLETGASHGVVPAGLGARDTLRLEAKLCLYGNDIDESTHPLEAGLSWVVKPEKGDFVGRHAIEELRSQGLRRKLVGFEMVGRGIGRQGHPIVDADGKAVGTVTSGSPGPTVGKNIGLGYVPLAHAAVGTKLGIDVRGTVVEAMVARTPFYTRPLPNDR